MTKFAFTALVLILLSGGNLMAQYYETGQDPASLRWREIRTGRFKIIYPENYEKGGKTFAKELNEADQKLRALFPEIKTRIPVVIHSYSTESNGYVAWAPKRMELYPAPEQNSIPLAPERQLALHEMAHVYQMSSLRTGFSRIMSFLFGEQYIGVTAGFLPLWFMEGDAVLSETVLSESGRGRSPSFLRQYKAVALEKGTMFSYDKAVNGSYRDFVPDHYKSGYNMVSWASVKYGTGLWNNMLTFTGKAPFTLNPVNISLRKEAGLTKKKLYVESIDSLALTWNREIKSGGAIQYKETNPPKKGRYYSYFSPVSAGADSIIALRTSLTDPPAIYMINPAGGKWQKLMTTGRMNSWDITYGGRKLVWVENQPDPRWENRNYLVVRIMDIDSLKVRRLSHRSRYMAAAISPDGKSIVAVENTSDNNNRLVFLDPLSGKITGKTASPANCHLQRPRWSENGEKIVVITQDEKGEGIMTFSPAGGKWETLVESSVSDLESACLSNDSLYYVSSVTGTENIMLRTPEGKTLPVTNSRFGATSVSLSGSNLLFCDYTSSGNNLGSIAPADFHDVPTPPAISSYIVNRLNAVKEPDVSVSDTGFISHPYRKWQHPFTLHSWMPFYFNIEQVQSDPAAVRPGISLMSQNLLSTLTTSVGYEYSAEGYNIFHSRVTWKGLWPVFEARLDQGGFPAIYRKNNSTPLPPVIISGRHFVNTVSLPLSFSSGKFSQYVYTSFKVDYSNDYLWSSGESAYDYGQTLMTGRFFMSNYFMTAVRDMYPKWAQSIDIRYMWAPFDRQIYGNLLSLRTAFWFPGILRNNNLKIKAEKEYQDPGQFLLSTTIQIPRGYTSMISKNRYFVSADYYLPLVYPDLHLSSLLYLKRIRLDLFADYTAGPGKDFYRHTDNGLVAYSSSSVPVSFKSYGAQLLADFHILRIPYLMSGGIQAAWKEAGTDPVISFVFNIELYGMTIGKRNP